MSIREKLGDVDILVVTDEGTPNLTGPTRFYQTRVIGHGVGKARNVMALYAYQKGYDCLIYMDGHMKILSDNLHQICMSDIGQPRIVVMENAQFPLNRLLPLIPNWSKYTLGSFLEKKTWKWGYIYSTVTRKTVMTTEPCYSISRRVIEALLQAQGEVTSSHYWGKESFDLTVSASRLGFEITIYPNLSVGHMYKVGSPSWSSRFLEKNCVNEPFCGVLSGSVYHNGIKWSDCVYALKHYHDISNLPVDSAICNLVRVYDERAVRSIKSFNAVAKYDLDTVYQKLQAFLTNASYGFVN